MLISSKISNLDCYISSDEYLATVSGWLEHNANRHYSEWEGLTIEGPQANGYILTFPEKGEKVFLKCFGVRNQKLYQNIPGFGLFSKARHAYRISSILHKKGITTPKPLAYVRFKSGPNKGKELLFTRWIDGSVTLGTYLDRFFAKQSDSHSHSRKRKLITLMAEFLRELHANGVYHRDLNRENVLIKEKGERFELYLIDTDDVQASFRISYKRVIKNLDKINRYILNKFDISTTDRMRFLKVYIGNNINNKTIRRYWKDVEKETFETLKKRNKMFVSKMACLTIIFENIDLIDNILVCSVC